MLVLKHWDDVYLKEGDVCNQLILSPAQGHTQHGRKDSEFYQISIIMGITSPGDHFNG